LLVEFNATTTWAFAVSRQDLLTLFGKNKTQAKKSNAVSESFLMSRFRLQFERFWDNCRTKVASSGLKHSGQICANMNEEERDPNNLNQHLQVQWDDVIGEPEGVRSISCVWKLSSWCFRSSRNCCYIVMSLILAPIMALCLGCTFACLAFEVHDIIYLILTLLHSMSQVF
ncbi:hypothetical protein C0J52_00792, partial [Blattella germanica]